MMRLGMCGSPTGKRMVGHLIDTFTSTYLERKELKKKLVQFGITYNFKTNNNARSVEISGTIMQQIAMFPI